MRDFHRLRDHLRRALLSVPLALPLPLAACGSSSPPPEDPLTNTTTDTSKSVADSDWPSAQGCGTWGTWCGPASQIARATGTDQDTSCVTSFQHVSLYFNYDQASTEAKRSDGDDVSCCYSYSDDCAIKGRPLFDRGDARVAPVREGGAWARGRNPDPDALRADALSADGNLRARLADAWLHDARVEHASIASFARATLELMAVGAPPELIADSQRAGLDEVRHAEGCFALVERYTGRALSPGPLAAVTLRAPTLEQVAVDTFVEGCVAETIATLTATRVVEHCRDPEVASFLRRIIRDETRHAALAWRTVAWAIRSGGPSVAAAVRARADEMEPRAPAPDVGSPDPVLLAHGRMDDRTRRDAVVDAWREIIRPTLDAIA